MSRPALRDACLVALAWLPLASAAERFPRPDLSQGYRAPAAGWPGAVPAWAEWLDLGLLATALGLAAWLGLWRRSRTGMVVLSLACLGYFGFWRQGCLCPVGSVQVVAEGLATGMPLPLSAVVFFMLPLLAALLFGRVFCAAVCPLGILQDLVAVRPHRLSAGLSAALQMLPVVLLALTVLLAATQTCYLACRFDPLVPLLRRSGTAAGVLIGGGTLLLGVILARPYCRFLCPYGLLLSLLSRLSWRHVTITPDTCVRCRLCADSCPFDAIEAATPERPAEPVPTGSRRLGWLLLCSPVLVMAFALLIAQLAPALARLHQDVRLSDQFRAEEAGGAAATIESTAFRSSSGTGTELHAASEQRVRALRRGGYWAGAFVGLVLASRLLGASVRRRHDDFVPDRGRCLSCGRCFRFCPKEHVRRRQDTEG
jgi:ferredoxin